MLSAVSCRRMPSVRLVNVVGDGPVIQVASERARAEAAKHREAVSPVEPVPRRQRRVGAEEAVLRPRPKEEPVRADPEVHAHARVGHEVERAFSDGVGVVALCAAPVTPTQRHAGLEVLAQRHRAAELRVLNQRVFAAQPEELARGRSRSCRPAARAPTPLRRHRSRGQRESRRRHRHLVAADEVARRVRVTAQAKPKTAPGLGRPALPRQCTPRRRGRRRSDSRARELYSLKAQPLRREVSARVMR